MARFFRFPWATSGDRTEVPFDTDPSGFVSYAEGYGPDYEITPGDPGWKAVPRDETNGLYYDLTDNIRQYQLNGAPDWHPAAANAGVAINYPLNAIVRHNDVVYRSLIANNTVEPGTDATKWAPDSVIGAATTVVAGITRYATEAEAAARTSTTLAVTPAGLGALFNLLLNNPVFPEVLNSTGLFTVTTPSTGVVRVAAGTQFVHRGAFTYTSALTDLPTVANKMYHLRWRPGSGFALYDLASGAYNPSALAETNAAFDTTYDDMLVAVVTTSAGNAVFLTSVANKNVLRTSYAGSAVPVSGPNFSWSADYSVKLNWARTPVGVWAADVYASSPGTSKVQGGANKISAQAQTRYTATMSVFTDWDGTVTDLSSSARAVFSA